MSERLPAPKPADFPDLLDTDVWTLPVGARLGRIYSAGGDHPTAWDTFRAFGPTRSRFDPQPPPRRVHPTRRVLYAAAYVASALPPPARRLRPPPLLETALAECFRDRGVVDRTAQSPYFTVFDLISEVRLLDLAESDWVTRAGGNLAIASGLRSRSREWARAIYRVCGPGSDRTAADRIDGVIYPCSHNPAARSVALWEAAIAAMPTSPTFNDPLTLRGFQPTLEAACSRLRLDIV
ncbi:RES family NAD+ phosphorylase (plasmid) [Dermatophilaceae bacterium Soc4.6]